MHRVLQQIAVPVDQAEIDTPGVDRNAVEPASFFAWVIPTLICWNR